ncbi:type II secretion system F family protein [Campylobacter fetus]|uniref:Type II secretion system F family protein n=6 Tax=Campylobacter fetus TaxID=196 RepID=A0A5L4XHW2_CAMFE|nr:MULTISPECIES: type II secretion system F family protein [Campylobacter]OCS23212.1 type II secretion system protein F [Campylobacter fetus subsp. venerealis cfvi97/532]OCS26747.1 type II secretion system protein F [Campylobacter fetus subsp. venerealis cfvB10]OCS30579.1 type II secretion system protein F [Campylobacter fetus subsp. venerealis LMG 6570 = CCUG 33900]ABK82741.1 type II secretion system protein [Campylobacter fetus subsp. fetus 82-40]AHE94066.1 transformation system, type II sec
MKIYEVEQIIKAKRNKIYIKAENRVEAKETAMKQNRGIVIKVTETKTVPLDMQISEIKQKLTQKLLYPKVKIPNLVACIRQLSVMTNAGISIHDSIKEVIKSTTDKRLKLIFENVNDDLNAGMSITESLNLYSDELGNVVIAMVRLGEESGNMAESLQKLAEILQEIWDNQRKFKKAIRYPTLVICAIAIAFVLLMVLVVPTFRDIFEQLNAELPLPTRILLNIEYLITNYGFICLGGIVLFLFILTNLYKKNGKFKNIFDKYILKVYLIKNIIFFSSMSRFNLIFTELVRAGIPINDALDTACVTISNSYIKNKLLGVKVNVQRGNPLNYAFSETKLYEGMLLQMISAGEKSGSLDSMLEKVTDYYKEKFNTLIDNISSYIEPILLVFIAATIILLGLGIFLPMWDMANAVK